MQAGLTAEPQKGCVSSLGPSYPSCREVQEHLLAPWGEGELGSVNQGTGHSRKGPCLPVLLQPWAVARGGQRHGTCCTGRGRVHSGAHLLVQGRLIGFANPTIIPLPSTGSRNSSS